MSTACVAEALEAAGDDDHAQPPLALRLVAADREHVPDEPPVSAVDELVELDQRSRAAARSRSASARIATPTISSARKPISSKLSSTCGRPRTWPASFVSFEMVTQRSAMRSRWRLLWRIASTRRRSTATGVCRASSDSTALLEREVTRVDLVVERDHLVAQLPSSSRSAFIAPRSDRSTSSDSSCRVCLEGVQLLLERRARYRHHPNRPVT